jgi:hypothetical protein
MQQAHANNTDRRSAIGAYGVWIEGLESLAGSLGPASPDWPRLRINRSIGPCPVQRPYVVGDDRAEVRIADQTGRVGGIRIDRDPLTASFTSPGGFSDDAMIHPDLGFLAAVVAKWSGREVFHAGAFLTENGVWAVLGTREAGKSTLLGLLAARGVAVFTDDALVVGGGTAFAGPRCVDLREGAADRLQQGTDIGLVGNRRRWRVQLPAVPASAPLAGWIVPEWGDDIELRTAPAAQRLALLNSSVYLKEAPPRPERLLALVTLPVVVFRRPRNWAEADAATTALLDRIAG